MVCAAIETENSFDPEKVKRAMDAAQNYKGLLGALSISPTKHAAMAVEDMTLATLPSGRGPKSISVFRERV